MAHYRPLLQYEEQRERTIMNDYEVFIHALKKKVYNTILAKIKSGEKSLSSLYESLGYPVLNATYGRLEIPDDLLHSLIDDVKNGKLILAESSWGNIEQQEDVKKGTTPGLDDFFPSSYGYNNVGGPKYNIQVTQDAITVTARFAHQEIDGWDTVNISEVWQARTFVMKNPDGNLSDENLQHFGNWIVNRELNRCMDNNFDKLVEKAANIVIQ